MHERFDRIDQRLNDIMDTVTVNFYRAHQDADTVKKYLRQNQQGIANLSIQMTEFEQRMERWQTALIQEVRAIVSEYPETKCQSRPLLDPSEITPQFVDDCAFRYVVRGSNSSEASTGPVDTIKNRPARQVNVGGGPEGQINYLAAFAGDLGHPMAPASRVTNPVHWALAANTYVGLATSYWDVYQRLDANARLNQIDDLLKHGARVDSLIRGITAIGETSGGLRQSPFIDALIRRHTRSVSALDTAILKNERAFSEKRLGGHSVQDPLADQPKQPRDALRADWGDCTRFKTPLLVPSTSARGKIPKHFTLCSLPLPSYFRDSISDRYVVAAEAGLGDFDILLHPSIFWQNNSSVSPVGLWGQVYFYIPGYKYAPCGCTVYRIIEAASFSTTTFPVTPDDQITQWAFDNWFTGDSLGLLFGQRERSRSGKASIAEEHREFEVQRRRLDTELKRLVTAIQAEYAKSAHDELFPPPGEGGAPSLTEMSRLLAEYNDTRSLVEAFIRLGMPDALDRIDAVRELVYGRARLLDANDIRAAWEYGSFDPGARFRKLEPEELAAARVKFFLDLRKLLESQEARVDAALSSVVNAPWAPPGGEQQEEVRMALDQLRGLRSLVSKQCRPGAPAPCAKPALAAAAMRVARPVKLQLSQDEIFEASTREAKPVFVANAPLPAGAPVVDVWVSAFIPDNGLNSLRQVGGGASVHAGKIAIADPVSVDACYLTDLRGFSNVVRASHRVRQVATLDFRSGTIAMQAHSDPTVKVGCASGDVRCQATASTAAHSISATSKEIDGATGRVRLFFRLKAAGKNPCATAEDIATGLGLAQRTLDAAFGAVQSGVPEINWDLVFVANWDPSTDAVSVAWSGFVDSYPAFEMYARRRGGATVTKLFGVAPPASATPLALYGDAKNDVERAAVVVPP